MPRVYTSRIEVVCQSCGKTFLACPSQCAGGRKKFCSVACRNAGSTTQEQRTCVACGKTFVATPGQITRGRRFCSRECAYGTPESRFDKYTAPPNDRGCIEWTGLRDEDGYGKIWTGTQLIGAHRFAYMQRHGSIPDGLKVCHTCDNPPCCNPDHLFLGTHADNHADRNAKGRQAKGEKSGNAKLTAEAVVEIRRLRQSGLSQQKIADRFGVHQSAVSSILLGKTWAHVV